MPLVELVLRLSIALVIFLHVVLHLHQLLGQSKVGGVCASSEDVILSLVVVTEFRHAFFVIVVNLANLLVHIEVCTVTVLSVFAHLRFKLFLLARRLTDSRLRRMVVELTPLDI